MLAALHLLVLPLHSLSFFAQMVARELPVESFAKSTLPAGFPVLSAGDRRVTEQSAPPLLAGRPSLSPSSP